MLHTITEFEQDTSRIRGDLQAMSLLRTRAELPFLSFMEKSGVSFAAKKTLWNAAMHLQTRLIGDISGKPELIRLVVGYASESGQFFERWPDPANNGEPASAAGE